MAMLNIAVYVVNHYNEMQLILNASASLNDFSLEQIGSILANDDNLKRNFNEIILILT